jgi:hypothetical protein
MFTRLLFIQHEFASHKTDRRTRLQIMAVSAQLQEKVISAILLYLYISQSTLTNIDYYISQLL